MSIDPGARGLGARALGRIPKVQNLRDLLNFASAAKLSNPIDRGAMVSPPTISTPQAAAFAGVTTAFSATAASPVFTSNATVTVSGSSLAQVYGYGRWSFITDCPNPALRLSANGNGFQVTNILVDGQYTSLTPSNLNIAQSNAYTKIDFAGVRQFRRFDVEIEGFPNFWGVNTGATDTIYAPAAAPRVVVVGDSYTGETGSSRPGGGWAYIMGWLCGWDVARDSTSPGGSGYIALGTNNQKFLDRVANVAAQSPAAIVVAGGINDAGNSSASITAAALTYFQTLRTGNPSAPIIVLGAWPGSTGPSASIIACETAILAAFTSWNDPFSRFLPVSTAAQAVIYGTGRTGALASNGNADFYIGGTDGTDATHPTQAGHTYLGRWAAAGVTAALKTLAATL